MPVSEHSKSLGVIDQAIERHREWVADFNAALAGTGTKVFDPAQAKDDSACALGHWFSDAHSRALLGEEFHGRAVAIHGAFHEIAGEVIESLAASDPPEVTRSLVAALEDLSRSLIEFLEFARKHCVGTARDWTQ